MTYANSAEVQGSLCKALAASRDFAVILVDDSARIAAWEGASERIFGYSREEAVGRQFEMLFTHEDADLGLHRQEMAVAQHSGRSEDDRWHVRKNGSRFWGSGVLEMHEDSAGRPMFVKMVRDRTDVRIQHEALRARLRAAERLNVERLRLLTGFAQALGQPLSSVSACVQRLKRLDMPASGTDDLQTILDAVQRMSRAVGELAGAAVSEAAGPVLHMERLTVRQSIDAAVAAMQSHASRHNQTIEVTLPEVDLTLEADKAALQHMLQGLLSHALKSSFDGGAVSVSASQDGDAMVIRIEDAGVGLPADQLAVVFDLFTQELHPPTSEVSHGELVAVRDLARLHGGVVEVRSPGSGLGSVFTLRLPLLQQWR